MKLFLRNITLTKTKAFNKFEENIISLPEAVTLQNALAKYSRRKLASMNLSSGDHSSIKKQRA